MFSAIPDLNLTRVPRRPRILAQIAATVFTLVASCTALAQGVNYRVAIEAPDPLDDLLQDNLDLLRWQGNPRLDMDQLQRLVKAVPEQANMLIATEGYYSPRVSAGLDTSGSTPVARVIVDPGKPTIVGDVDLTLKGFEPVGADAKPFDGAELRNRWALPVGARFRQADWEAAKRNLLRQVIQVRYPRAQLVESSAIVDPDVQRALLKVVLDSGPEARFGDIKIEGLKRYPSTIITNLNQIQPGEEYSEAALQAFQARLQDTGYFSGVEVSTDPGEMLDEQIDALAEGPAAKPKPPVENPVTLPVLVRVTENKQRNVSVGLGFSTNTGARAQVSYDDLNVYGLRMKSNLIMETRRQSANADFFFPTTAKGYNDSFGASFERNDLQGEITAVARLAARRAWGTPRRERNLTFEYLTEQQTIDGQPPERSKSLPLTFSYTMREVDNLLLPTRGFIANATLGGALLPVLTDERFIRASARVVGYKSLGAKSSLVLRAEAGALASAQKAGVPSTFLFRAGGDGSVRGYGYQALGVKEGDATVGGRYLVTGSAEYQYWFKPPWGVAFFVDAGNAADKIPDLKPKLGYGVGARWRSPVGPINVDVAYGQAAKEVRLHFSLGFTF
ncbi:autotransporter assembly complex family protein [Massilia sp. CF038]|uniref:autotransporter assembly complex protein TamA n=1 Tax=Massilia sp. CF038 TaxID=1881045 RepID=UPI000935560E|nr:autotransporter assembly complex family protein [Massilia sp. CF038]